MPTDAKETPSRLPRLRQGDIFILPRCPPLHGDQRKNRPVIIITPPQILNETDQDIIAIACSGSVAHSTKMKIALPHRDSEPRTKSGLNGACWAVLDWRIRIARSRFYDLQRIGYLTGDKLREIVLAYLEISAATLLYP